MDALLIQYPESVVVAGTLTTVDCDLHEVRSRVAAIKAALKLMFTLNPKSRTTPTLQRKLIAAHAALEVTPVLDDTGQIRYQAHAHLIGLAKPNWPYRGKDYLHKDGREITRWWRDAIGDQLFLSALMEPAREPLAALRYATKASHNLLWGQYKDPRFRDRVLPAELITARSDQLRGLNLTMDCGLFNKRETLAEALEME